MPNLRPIEPDRVLADGLLGSLSRVPGNIPAPPPRHLRRVLLRRPGSAGLRSLLAPLCATRTPSGPDRSRLGPGCRSSHGQSGRWQIESPRERFRPLRSTTRCALASRGPGRPGTVRRPVEWELDSLAEIGSRHPRRPLAVRALLTILASMGVTSLSSTSWPKGTMTSSRRREAVVASSGQSPLGCFHLNLERRPELEDNRDIVSLAIRDGLTGKS